MEGAPGRWLPEAHLQSSEHQGRADGRDQDHSDEQRLASRRGRLRDRGPGRQAVRARRAAADLALPLRAVCEEAVLRQHTQDLRLRVAGRGVRPRATRPQARVVKLTARALFLGALVIAATATCVRLGFWQLARMHYKHALHAAQRALLAQPPLEVEQALPASPPETGSRVRVRGRWDPSAHVLLSGRTHLGAAGVSLVSAVRLASGEQVLVERGWIAAED